MRVFVSFVLPGTLLELHYDACHLEEWREKNDETKKRRPERKGEYKVFQSVIEGQHCKGPTYLPNSWGSKWRGVCVPFCGPQICNKYILSCTVK